MPGLHGSGCSCSNESSETGGGFWLTQAIDRDSVCASGEATQESSKLLFRGYSERLDDSVICCSGDSDDPELIISLALTSPTKLTAITIIGGVDESHPNSVRLFSNADLGSFGLVHELEPTQTIDLAQDYCGVIQYPLRAAKFSNVQTLTLHFPASSALALHWIGLRGIPSGAKRQAVVTVYESRPNISDHKIPDSLRGGRFDVS